MIDSPEPSIVAASTGSPEQALGKRGQRGPAELSWTMRIEADSIVTVFHRRLIRLGDPGLFTVRWLLDC